MLDSGQDRGGERMWEVCDTNSIYFRFTDEVLSNTPSINTYQIPKKENQHKLDLKNHINTFERLIIMRKKAL